MRRETGSRFIGVFVTLMSASFPFWAWWGIHHDKTILVALFLFLLTALKYLQRRNRDSLLFLSAASFFLIATLLFQRFAWVMFYPVLVNLFFLVFCLQSLYPKGQVTFIEKFARLKNPQLDQQGVNWCRKVSLVWCVFFVINATLSSLTVWYGDPDLWGFYNGVLAYVAMGLLLAGEWLLRQWFLRRNNE